MRSILTFASVGLALALTLLLGPEAGLGLGLLIYLAGSNIMLRQEIRSVGTRMDKLLDLLPDLLPQHQEKTAATPSSPNDERPHAETAGELDQRIQSLEHKLDALLRQLESSPPLASPNAAQESPVQTQAPSPLSASPAPHTHVAAPGTSVSISIALPQPAEPPASQTSSRAWAELEIMQEILRRMAENLPPSPSSSGGDTAPLPPLETARPSAETPDDEPAPLRQPSMEELRAELDKLTRELNIEIKRHKQ